MRLTLLLLACLCSYCASAQLRYDANWTFGNRCGLQFTTDDSIVTYPTNMVSQEACATFSTSDGELLGYINPGIDPFFYQGLIMDAAGNVLPNGDSLSMEASSANGALVIPIVPDSVYLLFHRAFLSPWDPNLGLTSTGSLLVTKLLYQNGALKVKFKNHLLLPNYISESIEAIKHANGEDWWLIAHEESVNCTNTYFRFLIKKDTIIGPLEQQIGMYSCQGVVALGEMSANAQGTALVKAGAFVDTVELFDFDRCTGLLSNLVSFSPSINYPYGCEFSPSGEFIYIVAGEFPQGKVLQYPVQNVQNEQTIWLVTSDWSNPFYLCQLEMAIDEKIYISTTYIGTQTPYTYYTQNLSVINFPDSFGISCGLDTFSLPMDTACRTTAGLPSFPNYNLGATSIYQADAGMDAYICIGDTSIKGITIGGPAVSGVTYEWLSADIDTMLRENSQLFVSPDSTTTYYLQLTDTTIQGSCQTRTDSITIEIRDCTVDTTGLPPLSFNQTKVYPNPARQQVKIELPNGYKNVRFRLISLLGTTILQVQLSGTTLLDIAAVSPGIYLYEISITDQPLVGSGKLVVE